MFTCRFCENPSVKFKEAVVLVGLFVIKALVELLVKAVMLLKDAFVNGVVVFKAVVVEATVVEEAVVGTGVVVLKAVVVEATVVEEAVVGTGVVVLVDFGVCKKNYKITICDSPMLTSCDSPM